VQAVEVAIDTLDADRIRPFWAAVLAYRDVDGVLVDPLRLGPPMWFQTMDEPRPGRDRFHIDVSVPHDEAEARIEAALAAGGRMVTDRYARAWWVLADADGNEACVCTWQDRG
jgi:4a-hydroxytetrahydrobiopterin dehydratase